MRVLYSIKPEFADKIFDGTKHFEFRRTIFRNPNVKTIVVYATAPIGKVVGEFQVTEILFQELEQLWTKTRKNAGISEERFYSYFMEKKLGYAIAIGSARRYAKPRGIRESFGIKPPQSFAYLD